MNNTAEWTQAIHSQIHIFKWRWTHLSKQVPLMRNRFFWGGIGPVKWFANTSSPGATVIYTHRNKRNITHIFISGLC